MESRLRRLFLSVFPAGIHLALLAAIPLFSVAGAAQAQEEGGRQALAIEPQVERREIHEAAIDTEDFEIGVFGGLLSVEDFGVNAVAGARIAYHATEDFFFEGAYGVADTQKSSYEELSGSASLMNEDERRLSYYNVSLGYNLLPGEAFIGRGRAYNTALYLIGGIGSAEFAGDDHFTVNLGFGYRLLANDWLALHLDTRDHIFDTDLLGKSKTTHNLELHGGFTIFF